MPIYAKCRLDEGASSSFLTKNQKIKESWKIVKMIDVAKYLIWNMILGAILIYLQSILLVKFFVTLILLFMFSVLSVAKWIPGLVYIIKYKMNEKEHTLEPSQ
jgi:cellulose synthase/poly-beta-1,6-N-acetylglucosamine synthase-like glycosyltransferase